MKKRYGTRLIAVALSILGLFPLVALSKGRLSGGVTGSVRDDQGAPIIGAIVRLVDAATLTRTLRSLRTNAKGEFFAANIQPGNYRLRAEAKGFISDVQMVEVRPEMVLSARFELRRTGRLLDTRADRDDYKWAVRSVPDPILRIQNESPGNIVRAGDKEGDAIDQRLHGLLQFHGGSSGPVSPAGGRTGAGLNFALARQLSRNLEMILAGQWSADSSAPQRFELVASTFPADEHQLTIVFRLGQFTGFDRSGNMLREQQSTIRLSDEWQVAGPVVVLYGMDLTRFSGAVNQVFSSPRIGLRYSPSNRTTLEFDYAPAEENRGVLEGYQGEAAQVDFTDPGLFRSFSPGTRLRPSQRLQLGFERLLTDQSSIAAAVFFDDVSGRAVGLLAVPDQVSDAFRTSFRELTEQGQTRGARVVYSARLNRFLSGLVGYAFGQGHTLSAGDFALPGTGSDRFHVVSFKLGGEIARSNTTYAAYYRIASRTAVFAVDPFYGRLQVFDPGLSLVMTQELPTTGLLPGRWVASVDGRNLLDQRGSWYGHEGWNLITSYGRSVRGSVSVRF
ncbi:MAG: TonB-dependent receptor [Acidobacteria bacterium]|nr:TonB-dependent receptor [Acidobacteriota bacterium]